MAYSSLWAYRARFKSTIDTGLLCISNYTRRPPVCIKLYIQASCVYPTIHTGLLCISNYTYRRPVISNYTHRPPVYIELYIQASCACTTKHTGLQCISNYTYRPSVYIQPMSGHCCLLLHPGPAPAGLSQALWRP
jgi:hypothetical protein